MLEILGFTTMESTIWNTGAYASLIAIMFGITYERFRKQIFVIAPFILMLYSGFFLEDRLLAVSQLLITVSGLLGMFSVNYRTRTLVMLCLVPIASTVLLAMGVLNSMVATVGFFGLLGIVFGVLLIPKPKAFLLLVAGTVLLLFYSFSVSAWVFFVLNIFLLFANTAGYVKASQQEASVSG